jgi:hypothetical protein
MRNDRQNSALREIYRIYRPSRIGTRVGYLWMLAGTSGGQRFEFLHHWIPLELRNSLGVTLGENDRTLLFITCMRGFVSLSVRAGGNSLSNNSGLDGQVSANANAYIGNFGSSSYNGLLVTLKKTFSRGLQFDFNYTFSLTSFCQWCLRSAVWPWPGHRSQREWLR